MNSEEYDMLSQLTKDYPNYTIKTSTMKRQNKYKNLSIPFMREYIKQRNEKLLDGFENELLLYANASTWYFHMKSWFLENCPEYEQELNSQKEARERKAEQRKMGQKEKAATKKTKANSNDESQAPAESNAKPPETETK